MSGGAVVGRLGLLLRLGVEEMMVPATQRNIFYLYSLHTQHIMWYSLVKSKEAGDLLFVCQGWTMLGAHYELFILSSHLLHPNFLTSLLASILETPDLEITRLAPNFKRTDNFSQF